MFGAVSAELILDALDAGGIWQQPELPLNMPPRIILKDEYMQRVSDELHYYDSNDREYRRFGIMDHPSFTNARKWLEREGYIKAEWNWSNGDRVLKPFYINDYLFEEGEQFPCASALGNMMKR